MLRSHRRKPRAGCRLCHTCVLVFRSRRRPRRPAIAVASVVVVLGLTGCEPHTVDLGFDPAVGDVYRFESTIRTEVLRTVDDRVEEPEVETSTLAATETVTDIDDGSVSMDVSITRDDAPARNYTALFDRGQHLTAADLVEGAASDAVGLDLAADLPTDLSSPPAGPLEPGERWTISRSVDTGHGAIVVTGTGRVVSLRVEDGNNVAVVEVELTVPIRSSLDNPNGEVLLDGTQIGRSRTVYDLTEGTVRSDQTSVEGEVRLVFRPPEGVQAEPVLGSIVYSVATDTRRVPDVDAK